MFFTALRPAPQTIMTLNAALRRDDSYFICHCADATTSVRYGIAVFRHSNFCIIW
jgi:hypothetical protein